VEYLDAETGRIDKAIAAEEKMIALLQERREIVINEAVSGSGKCGSEGVDFNAEAQRRRVRRGWEVRPLRAFLRPVSVRNRPDEQLLSVTRETGVIVRDVTSKEENHNYIPDDLSCYKFVAKGQFVINKMKAWQGSYGVSPYDGIVSPAYFVYDLNFPCKEFFNIALRSKFYVPYFQRYSKGIRIDQWDLMPEALKLMPFAYPPLSEQEEIVKYLDAETGKIDRAIEVKRRQIELLRERRQIVIDEAVTGKVRVA
jgi:type I restriction enzyme S subunit